MKEDINQALLDGRGVISAREHPELGQRLRRLGRQGDLTDILPGLWVQPATRDDWHVRLTAGLKWLGPDAVVAGHAAARLTFWPDCPHDDLAFIVPHAVRHQRGWSVMNSRVPPEMRCVRGGVQVTCPAYTAVDLSASAGGNIIDVALRSRQATLNEMWAALDAMRDRSGNRQRRWLLGDSRDEPWSELEREAHRLLRKHRLTGWTTNAWTPTSGDRGYHTDILFGRLRLVIEFDGYEFHSSPTAFERDRLRRNELVTAGYRVLNFTWTEVFLHPERVIDTIKRAIEMSNH